MTDFAYKPTLTGDLVVLRPLDEGDYDALTSAMAETEVTRFTDPHDDGSPLDEQKYREWLRTRKDQSDRLDLAIVSRATGLTVGEAVLNEWSPEDESCNFRILIGSAGRGQGLGTEATRLIVGYGFEQLGLYRISLTVYSFNPRAQRVYEKAGFVEEGRLRQAVAIDGTRYDDILMSILAPKWEALRSSA